MLFRVLTKSASLNAHRLMSAVLSTSKTSQPSFRKLFYMQYVEMYMTIQIILDQNRIKKIEEIICFKKKKKKRILNF